MLSETVVLRVAMLCSRRAPGLAELLDVAGRAQGWRIVVGVTSSPESEMPSLLRAAEVPAVTHDIVGFYRARGQRWSDLTARDAYDRVTVDLLRPFRPDLVVLCGYVHIVTAPLLAAYPSRIINIHDSDLTLTDAEGRPRYRGLRSTRDAIVAGEPETRSTVHIVTPEVDVGPMLVRSDAFPTHPKVTAYAQREWMMRASWGTLLAQAIEIYARGQVRVEEARVA
jgi:phosphoribosylglycinamide formyltransferase 1